MIKSSSLFSQLLAHIPRGEFAALVARHEAHRGAKGFSCWTQLVAMLFCHLARAGSLREICHGLTGALGKLVHLGVQRGPNKSTLSYANAHRPAALFEDLFWRMLDRFRRHGGLGARKRQFRFKNKLLSLDSTTISLCLTMFPWATYRRAKGGVKLHLLLDHDDYLPAYALVSEARMHDRRAVAQMKLPAGSIVVYDRGYVDYALFDQLCRDGVFFVTRLKEGARVEPAGDLALPGRAGPVLRDQMIVLESQACREPLRRITVWDEANCREVVLLTNNLELAASTIAAIYKDRWEIELFFKTLKQQLRVKTFVGTSQNALRIQIWTALIALLLLRWLHHLSRASWSLSNLAALLRFNLFTYRDLRQWLADPLGSPPLIPDAAAPVQLTLDFGQPV
jgi:hypothetical protein